MDVIMPQLGETVAEGVVTRWHKKVGDNVTADDTLFDVETDKVNTEIPAPASGVIAEILVDEGASAKVGARLAVIREKDPLAAASFGSQTAQALVGAVASLRTTSRPAAAAEMRLSPIVRRLIAEHGLDPAEIHGTGSSGRITRSDVMACIESRAGVTDAQSSVPEQRKRLNSVRLRTGERMVKSWTTTPHVMQAMEADFHKIEEARRSAAADRQSRLAFPITLTPFVASAVAEALVKFPMLNASLDGNDLVLHARINIGVAVDLNFDGLVVPVVKDVTQKSLPQLAREIRDYTQRARANRLKPDEIAGATYTLSSSGVYGTLITAPIINLPQVAILSMDGVHKRPTVVSEPSGDTIAIRPIGVLAQTFDHRAVDGAYSAAFLREVKNIIESRDWIKALHA